MSRVMGGRSPHRLVRHDVENREIEKLVLAKFARYIRNYITKVLSMQGRTSGGVPLAGAILVYGLEIVASTK